MYTLIRQAVLTPEVAMMLMLMVVVVVLVFSGLGKTAAITVPDPLC